MSKSIPSSAKPGPSSEFDHVYRISLSGLHGTPHEAPKNGTCQHKYNGVFRDILVTKFTSRSS
jgi:hypothetical protein